MIKPETYAGYDNNGKIIAQYTGFDANQHINPAEVKTAIDNVKTTFKTEMGNIKKALNNIETDADEAIIVEGTKMNKVFDSMGEILDAAPDSISDGLDSLYDESVSVHDKIQTQANTQAREMTAAVQNVIKVIP